MRAEEQTHKPPPHEVLSDDPSSLTPRHSMKTPSSLEELISALRCLPGVGPKSAQRMAYHLLQRDKPGAQKLADSLRLALERVRHCEKCNNYAEEPKCLLCRSPRRDATLLCIVETPGPISS